MESGKPHLQAKAGPGLAEGSGRTLDAVEMAGTAAEEVAPGWAESLADKYADDFSDLSEERPQPNPAEEALKPQPCRCDHPVPWDGEDGRLCAKCGRAAV